MVINDGIMINGIVWYAVVSCFFIIIINHPPEGRNVDETSLLQVAAGHEKDRVLEHAGKLCHGAWDSMRVPIGSAADDPKS